MLLFCVVFVVVCFVLFFVCCFFVFLFCVLFWLGPSVAEMGWSGAERPDLVHAIFLFPALPDHPWLVIQLHMDAPSKDLLPRTSEQQLTKKRTDTYEYSVCCVFCFVISFYCFVVLLLKPTRIAKETVRRQRQPSVDCQPRYATRTAKEIVRRQRQPSADCQPHYATRIAH